jgi:hypothetical protein
MRRASERDLVAERMQARPAGPGISPRVRRARVPAGRGEAPRWHCLYAKSCKEDPARSDKVTDRWLPSATDRRSRPTPRGSIHRDDPLERKSLCILDLWRQSAKSFGDADAARADSGSCATPSFVRSFHTGSHPERPDRDAFLLDSERHLVDRRPKHPVDSSRLPLVHLIFTVSKGVVDI